MPGVLQTPCHCVQLRWRAGCEGIRCAVRRLRQRLTAAYSLCDGFATCSCLKDERAATDSLAVIPGRRSFLSLSPFLRGEGWGEGPASAIPATVKLAETPPHLEFAFANSSLSPHAGRGEVTARAYRPVRTAADTPSHTAHTNPSASPC
ncbi:hypothetical protein GTH44_24190 [Bradyrhizobium japonicum]|nr:hypothetical protein [Bradyrhizobium japonicum]